MKNTWPCEGKPETRAGQAIGMYHCEFCGEMQLAGVPHLPPQFPPQWEEPFPHVEEPPPQPYLFLGDTHGDLKFVVAAAERARRHNAEIIQLGDWGFLWPDSDQLADLSEVLVAVGVTLRFLDGNHDCHPELRRLCDGTVDHGVTIAPNVIYQPRGSVHEDVDGTRFLFLGGAPSIDAGSREPGVSWWPEEVITDAEFQRAKRATGPIHVIVTHDACQLPPGFTPKGTLRYQAQQQTSMERVAALIRHHRPLRHFHGHWHVRHDLAHGNGTVTHGLDCNQLDSSYLDDSTFLWSRAEDL